MMCRFLKRQLYPYIFTNRPPFRYHLRYIRYIQGLKNGQPLLHTMSLKALELYVFLNQFPSLPFPSMSPQCILQRKVDTGPDHPSEIFLHLALPKPWLSPEDNNFYMIFSKGVIHFFKHQK